MLISLTTVLKMVCLVSPSSLSKKENITEIRETNKKTPFTHYQICEYNRLRIKDDSVYHHDTGVSFQVYQQINEFDWKKVNLYIPYFMNTGPFRLELKGAIVTLRFSNGVELSYDDTFTFLVNMSFSLGRNPELDGLLDLDVTYIGQTEIKEGKTLRFENHEKIFTSSNDIIKSRPEKECVIKLMSFGVPEALSQMIPEILSDDTRKDWHNGELIRDIPENQWKTIVEAALINYFQTTEYNDHYTKHFPLKSHCYKYFYERNIASIAVELQEENMAYRTRLKGADPKRFRMIRYALDSELTEALMIDNSKQMPDELYEKLTGFKDLTV